MNKKIQKHGPLYEHAKSEIELAGVSSGKGNFDQTLSRTVLKLVDVFERSADTDLLKSMISNMFTTLASGEILNKPTTNPAEWDDMPESDGVKFLIRCPLYRTVDNGQSWYRIDNGNGGVSIKYEEVEDASETTERVQPDESKRPAGSGIPADGNQTA